MRYVTMQSIRGNCTLVIDTRGIEDPREIHGPNHAMKAERIALMMSVEAYGAEASPRASSPADPPTSSAAEAHHTASGKRDKHARIAWALVLANPGKTAHELWSLATDRERDALGTFHELYRRLNDLRHEMAVKQGPPRKCTVRGSRMVVWDPA